MRDYVKLPIPILFYNYYGKSSGAYFHKWNAYFEREHRVHCKRNVSETRTPGVVLTASLVSLLYSLHRV